MNNKKTVLWFALIVMAIIPACAQQYDTRLNGTWKSEDDSIVKYNSGNFESFDENGNPNVKGTYTTSNGKITSTYTHSFGDKKLDTRMEARWYSKDELIKNFPYTHDSDFFEPYTEKYVINGNKLTFTDDDGETYTLTLVSQDVKFIQATDNSKKSVPVKKK